MPVSRIASLRLLLISLLFAHSATYAAESKDASKTAVTQAGASASAMDRVNAHANANPNDVQALFMRAVMLAEQNKREEAIKAFTEITEKYPDLPESYNNLAVLYADQGKYDKARIALENAIKTHPSYATAHENLGDIYAKMASEAYDKALQLDSGNARTQSKLSLIKNIFVNGSKPPANTKMAETKTAETKTADTKAADTKPADAAKDAAKPTITVLAIIPPPKSSSTPPVPSTSSSPSSGTASNSNNSTPPAVAKPDTAAAVASKPASDNKAPAENKVGVETKPTSNDSDSADKREVNAAVIQWAKAWSNKDIPRYLGSYASSFRAPDGLSRSAWEQNRRQRIDKPTPINVEISNIKVKQESSNRALVSFRQNYRSGGMAQSTNKLLTMVKANGKWQIEQERNDR